MAWSFIQKTTGNYTNEWPKQHLAWQLDRGGIVTRSNTHTKTHYSR